MYRDRPDMPSGRGVGSPAGHVRKECSWAHLQTPFRRSNSRLRRARSPGRDDDDRPGAVIPARRRAVRDRAGAGPPARGVRRLRGPGPATGRGGAAARPRPSRSAPGRAGRLLRRGGASPAPTPPGAGRGDRRRAFAVRALDRHAPRAGTDPRRPARRRAPAVGGADDRDPRRGRCRARRRACGRPGLRLADRARHPRRRRGRARGCRRPGRRRTALAGLATARAAPGRRERPGPGGDPRRGAEPGAATSTRSPRCWSAA